MNRILACHFGPLFRPVRLVRRGPAFVLKSLHQTLRPDGSSGHGSVALSGLASRLPVTHERLDPVRLRYARLSDLRGPKLDWLRGIHDHRKLKVMRPGECGDSENAAGSARGTIRSPTASGDQRSRGVPSNSREDRAELKPSVACADDHADGADHLMMAKATAAQSQLCCRACQPACSWINPGLRRVRLHAGFAGHHMGGSASRRSRRGVIFTAVQETIG